MTVYQQSNIIYAYPEVRFTAKVSSGTYVRSLVEDIGKELETGAYMSALRRTHVGEFKLEDAQPIGALDGATIEKNLLTMPEPAV